VCVYVCVSMYPCEFDLNDFDLDIWHDDSS